jgi:hypothetical protein
VKKIFFCLLLFNFQHLQSQSLKWYEGSIVLASNKVRTGKISIEPLLDVILLQEGELRTVYPAYKILSLYFYDEVANINRRFISMKDHDDIRTRYQFFELVLLGEVSVLRRQKTRSFSASDAFDFTYHVKYKNEFVPLRKFTRKIYPKLTTRSDKRLVDFISKNGLKANNDANSIRIIEFYNRLSRSDEVIAKH